VFPVRYELNAIFYLEEIRVKVELMRFMLLAPSPFSHRHVATWRAQLRPEMEVRSAKVSHLSCRQIGTSTRLAAVTLCSSSVSLCISLFCVAFGFFCFLTTYSFCTFSPWILISLFISFFSSLYLSVVHSSFLNTLLIYSSLFPLLHLHSCSSPLFFHSLIYSLICFVPLFSCSLFIFSSVLSLYPFMSFPVYSCFYLPVFPSSFPLCFVPLFICSPLYYLIYFVPLQ
jgi:hypothetical protein